MATYQTRCLDDADQIIKEHERKTKTTYGLLRSTKNFGCVDVPACTNTENEVRFETAGVPYCGVPFYVAGLKILQCQSSRNKNLKRKRPIKVEGTNGENEEGEADNDSCRFASKKRRPQNSRCSPKGSCTATVIMKEVIYYPKFQIHEHSKSVRLSAVRQLKESLKARLSVQKDRIIYVTVPSASDHSGHHVVNTGSPKSSARRLYVKNYYYGNYEGNSTKMAYYPVKKETCPPTVAPPRLKVDQDDIETKSREVREVLQSIMALTYKPGNSEAFQELARDLLQAKFKYQESLQSVVYTPSSTVSHSVVHTVQSVAPTHQLVAVQTANAIPHGTITMSSPTHQRTGIQLLNHSVIPGTATVVALTTLPQTSASTSGNTVAVTQPITTTTTDTTTSENSIFLEAMEAIFNPQM